MDKQHLEVEQSHQLRGIAILMILLVHSINEYPAYEAQWSKWLLIPEWGELACSIFFLLSGYGLTISMQKAQGREHKFCYWMSKIRKLIVPFLFAYLLTVVALSLYDGKYGAAYQFDVSTLFTLCMSDGNEMWFLKVILADYLLLCFWDVTETPLAVRVATCFALHLIAVVLLRTMGYGRYWYVSNLCFPVGMLLALSRDTMSPKQTLAWASLCVTIGILCYKMIHWRMAGEIIINVGFALFTMVLAARARAKCPVLRFLGKNSLYLYLFEIPVMWVIPNEGIHWFIYYLACLTCTALCAILYVELCECWNRRNTFT